MKKTGVFATFKIIHSAMLIGQVLFIAILVYLAYHKTFAQGFTSLDKILQIIAIAFAATAFFWGINIFKKRLLLIRESRAGNVKEMFDKYRQASIIQWAMLEGASLFCGISFFCTGNYAFLALAAVLIILFALQAPIKSKTALQLGLGIADVEGL